MADSALQQLKPELMTLAAADVDAPAIPMSTELQEAHDLYTAISDPEVQQALRGVGLAEAATPRLKRLVDAAREAQSEWTVVRDRSKTAEQREQETAGQSCRSRSLRACRWNLRADPSALDVVNGIEDGEGVDDLVQDLLELALLMERKEEAFASDASFDRKATIAEARALSEKLESSTSRERLREDQLAAKDLRDRAYTMLHALVAEIREAGRYAFADRPQKRQLFASEYRRRKARRRRAATTPPTPPVPGDDPA